MSICIAIASHDAGEAHEGHGQQAGGEERDGDAFHRRGDVQARELLADAGEDDEREREADGRREGEDDGLRQVVILLNNEDGDAKDGAVGRDQRQEDAEGLLERGGDFLEDDLHHLHQGGDDEDEDDGL